MAAPVIKNLNCKQCGAAFEYEMKASPNYPKFCPPHRVERKLLSRDNHERTRDSGDRERDRRARRAAAAEVGDYNISPFKLLDLAMRQT